MELHKKKNLFKVGFFQYHFKNKFFVVNLFIKWYKYIKVNRESKKFFDFQVGYFFSKIFNIIFYINYYKINITFKIKMKKNINFYYFYYIFFINITKIITKNENYNKSIKITDLYLFFFLVIVTCLFIIFCFWFWD